MSWSPGFCELSGGRDREQCSAEGSIGKSFVLHGLWPQFRNGYPSECAPDRPAPRYAVESAVPPYPTAGLARYQWRKHGSCSGLAASAYFTAASEAFNRIKSRPGSVSWPMMK